MSDNVILKPVEAGLLHNLIEHLITRDDYQSAMGSFMERFGYPPGIIADVTTKIAEGSGYDAYIDEEDLRALL